MGHYLGYNTTKAYVQHMHQPIPEIWDMVKPKSLYTMGHDLAKTSSHGLWLENTTKIAQT